MSQYYLRMKKVESEKILQEKNSNLNCKKGGKKSNWFIANKNKRK